MGWLDKVRNTATGNTSSNSAPQNKKDPKEPPPTWLQKLKDDPEPVKENGSDKFFGAENFGNTCYFNSILQCLFYSAPFRDLILNYPQRSPTSTILNDENGNPRMQPSRTGDPSPARGKGTPQGSSRGAGVPANPNKPEDKESPDYKKKQAILEGPILTVDYDNSKTYNMEPSLFTCLKDTFESIIAHSARTGVVSPRLFLKMLQEQIVEFRGAMHHDAHEALLYLLDAVIESMEEHNKKLLATPNETGEANGHDPEMAAPGPSITELSAIFTRLQDLIGGVLAQEIKCLTCENISEKDEVFRILSLDIENHCSVTSSLRKYSLEEMLCEREKFQCDNCKGLQEAEKRIRVKRVPKILALHLKRFQMTPDYQRLQKLFHRVAYPYHLRLFNTTDDIEDPDRMYELYAVVVHIGSSMDHGHYVSIIKTTDRGWLLFDDEMVQPVDKSFVRNFFGAQVGMACAYILFYQETTLEAVKKEQAAEGLEPAVSAVAAEVTVNENNKDTVGLGIKTNGHAQSGSSPIIAAEDDGAPFASLKHASTAPTPIVGNNTSIFQNSNSTSKQTHVALHAGTPIPSPNPTKADKKAAAREEKERKAAERAAEKAEKEAQKALEKEEKARKKSMEQRNREVAKAQAKEIRNSLPQRRKTNETLAVPEPGTLDPTNTDSANSGNTVAVISGPPVETKAVTSIPAINSTPTSKPSTEALQNVPASSSPAHAHSSSFSGGSGLSRFRSSSKSVSMRKSKFWPSSLGRDSRDMSRDSKDFKREEDVAVYDADDAEGVKAPILTSSTASEDGGKDKGSGNGLAGKGDKIDAAYNKENKPLPPIPQSSGTLKKRGFSLRKKASSLLN